MGGGNRTTDNNRLGADVPLAGRVYIVADQAHCLHKPEANAAVRVIPPYGSEVEVVQDAGSWVRIRFYGKDAWSPRENLSPTLATRREAVEVGVVPPPNYGFKAPNIHDELSRLDVEYGPRGGRFVRTASGFRRYF